MLAALKRTRPEAPAAVVVRGHRELAALRPGWEALARTAGAGPMQDFAWIAACAATVDADQPLTVVVIGAPVRPTAVAPLVRRGGHLELLGATRLGEPSDLLYADEAALASLASELARLRRPLLLARLPAGSATVAALRRALRSRSLVVVRRSPPHAAIALDDGWTAPEGRLSARRASDVRRARRRAEAAGGLEAEMLSPGPDGLDALLDEAFSIEARGWKTRAGTALAVDDDRAAFYRRYAAAASERGELRLAFLRIGGRRVAMQLGVEWGDRLWLLKIGHDEAVARTSPGTLLLLETVRDAAARGLGAVELLGGIEPWTHMWTDDRQPCETVVSYPPAPASVVAGVRHASVVVRGRLAARRATARPR